MTDLNVLKNLRNDIILEHGIIIEELTVKQDDGTTIVIKY